MKTTTESAARGRAPRSSADSAAERSRQDAWRSSLTHPGTSLGWTGKIQGAICIFSSKKLFARERCRSWWARGAPLVPRAGGGPRCSGLGRRRANGARRWRRFALVRRVEARLNARPAHASASFEAVRWYDRLLVVRPVVLDLSVAAPEAKTQRNLDASALEDDKQRTSNGSRTDGDKIAVIVRCPQIKARERGRCALAHRLPYRLSFFGFFLRGFNVTSPSTVILHLSCFSNAFCSCSISGCSGAAAR